VTDLPDWAKKAREHWKWRGESRPHFAVVPAPDEISVWDFPRPPVVVPDHREVVISRHGVEVARTQRALCVLETSHPPSFYLPWDDIARHFLQPAAGTSFCEWKGPARYHSLVDGTRRLSRVAWSYPQPLAGAEAITNCVAFYPQGLECCVDGAVVESQPGGFYGGWITPELTGPFKGVAGSEGW